MRRQELLQNLCDEITSLDNDRPLLVAIDGRDAAGKTILAKELSEALREEGRPVIEASIDGFHNPRSIRYGRGKDDPEGYLRDSFNIKDLKKDLLVPLKVGCLKYRNKSFDYRLDEEVESEKKEARRDSILVFDGVFTHQKELRVYWNYSIYLHVSEEESLRRGIERDSGEADEIRRRYEVRYLPGQRLYHQESEPEKHASIIIDNTDPENPVVLGEPEEE